MQNVDKVGFSSKNIAICFAALALCALSTFVLARYLKFQPFLLTWAVSFLLTVLALWQRPFRTASRRALIFIGVLSAILDLSIMAGAHIVIGSPLYPSADHALHNSILYRGLSSDNFISPFSPLDPLAFAAMYPAVFALCLAPCSIALRNNRNKTDIRVDDLVGSCSKRLDMKWLVLDAVIMLALWTPYLLTYWPGFVFGDSVDSIRQVLGLDAWTDHFPVAYTAFIGACFSVAHAFGFGNTAGCVLYSALQMLFMAFCFSHCAQWIVARGRLRQAWGLVISIAFGCTPFIAVYSISMWKDPIFSAALLTLSLLLMDFAWTKGAVAFEKRAWLPLYTLMLAIAALFRSNGLLVIMALLAVFAVMLARSKANGYRPRGFKMAIASTATVAIAALVFTGPISSALGIGKVGLSEGAGILYDQMARVVTSDGNMNEANRDYLDSLLPIEQYPQSYHPCCFDLLKYELLENNPSLEVQPLLVNWFQMLASNPAIYVEAWQLQTFGFWSLNDHGLSAFPNIASGFPFNTTTDSHFANQLEEVYDIHAGSRLPGDSNRWMGLFPQDSWEPPAAFLFWIALYLACLCLIVGKGRWAVSLVPVLVLFASIFVATPLCYWPRYVAAAYFLIPYFAFMLFFLMKPIAPSKTGKMV